MIPYSGKSKCGFCHGSARRAKWKSETRLACESHKEKIKDGPDPKLDFGKMTRADHQTWGRL